MIRKPVSNKEHPNSIHIGYALYSSPNGTDMFFDCSQVPRCCLCGQITDFRSTNPDYAFKRRFTASYLREGVDLRNPLTYTWDLRNIASQAFKAAGLSKGLMFNPIFGVLAE